MTDWWEKPYQTGPKVAVKGFPRPLYPPDAEPEYNDSIDGPDVEGIKRTVSRAGRWKWQQFDQAYSNGFAHGKGSNVIDTGVAGIQRQMSIDDSGYVGEKTFDMLRSIRVPEGQPHEGEMCMDARSVELINAAWDKFHGQEPKPPTITTSAQARLKKAITYIGTKEQPAGSNKQPFGVWYGMNGVPWCAIFCTYCDQYSGRPTNSFARGTRYAYVPYIVNDARLGLRGLSITSNPKPGDLVCFDWDRNGEYDHVGLFERWNSTSPRFVAIEGNTSMSNNSNGGEVMRRDRNRTYQNTVFVRVAE